jgi:hypothetical protein
VTPIQHSPESGQIVTILSLNRVKKGGNQAEDKMAKSLADKMIVELAKVLLELKTKFQDRRLRPLGHSSTPNLPSSIGDRLPLSSQNRLCWMIADSVLTPQS